MAATESLSLRDLKTYLSVLKNPSAHNGLLKKQIKSGEVKIPDEITKVEGLIRSKGGTVENSFQNGRTRATSEIAARIVNSDSPMQAESEKNREVNEAERKKREGL